MHIGDRVRLLKGTEEGIIVGFKGKEIVEIEIEDGFVIPALRKEVVVVDKRESKAFDREVEPMEDEIKAERKGYLAEGVYFGLAQNDDGSVTGYIINQTPDILLYSVRERIKKNTTGRAYGICRPFTYEETGIFSSSVFHQASMIILQVIIHNKEAKFANEPYYLELNLTRDILKKQTWVEMIKSELALINIGEYQTVKLDPKELKEKMLEPHDLPAKPESKQTGPKEQTIDLHIDPEKDGLNPEEVLEHQLDEFEKAYDRALLMNAEKLTIIHGVGSGKLRVEIHRRLSRKSEVKYYEDAAKEKFGYGATTVYFR